MQLQKQCKILMISAPKGGVGKTTLARALLVSAAMDRLKVGSIDFDEQESLVTWAGARERTRKAFPEFVKVEVGRYELSDWRAALKSLAGFDIGILDTPPGVGANITAIHHLAQESHCVLVPTSASPDDMRKVLPWGRALQKMGVSFAYVLIRVNPRTISFQRAATSLNEVGRVFPISIPQLESVPADAEKGLTVLDIERSKGIESFEATWYAVKRELGIAGQNEKELAQAEAASALGARA